MRNNKKSNRKQRGGANREAKEIIKPESSPIRGKLKYI